MTWVRLIATMNLPVHGAVRGARSTTVRSQVPWLFADQSKVAIVRVS